MSASRRPVFACLLCAVFFGTVARGQVIAISAGNLIDPETGLRDINGLKHIDFVMKNGEIYRKR